MGNISISAEKSNSTGKKNKGNCKKKCYEFRSLLQPKDIFHHYMQKSFEFHRFYSTSQHQIQPEGELWSFFEPEVDYLWNFNLHIFAILQHKESGRKSLAAKRVLWVKSEKLKLKVQSLNTRTWVKELSWGSVESLKWISKQMMPRFFLFYQLVPHIDMRWQLKIVLHYKYLFRSKKKKKKHIVLKEGIQLIVYI